MIYIDDHIEELDLEAASVAVGHERSDYALRYKREHDRRLCLAAYLLLLRGLRMDFGIDGPLSFHYGPYGKPTLVDYANVHFNLSHCREAAACAIGPHPVGIDVENIDRYNEELTVATMNENECRLITGSPHPALAFARLWTMKESLLKLTGEGLADDMRSVLDGCHRYRFVTTVCSRYVCTVCESGETLPPSLCFTLLNH